MKFDLKDLLILEAIHQQGTFAKAGEHLRRTPSAITQSVQKLEELLGFQIFDRSQYRPILTEQGRFFLERGRNILKQMDQLDYDLQLIQKGWETEFSIAYDDLLAVEGIFTLIKDFQKVAPGVVIRLHREVLNGCWDALLQGRSILAIGASGEPPIGLSCAQQSLGSTTFVFAIASNHPLATQPDPLKIEDISTHYSIVISDTSQQMPTRSSGIFPNQPIIVVPNMNAKITAQVQGLGVGYLPRHRIENLLNKGILIERSLDHLKSKVHLKTVWRTDKQSQILSWFLKQLSKKEIQKSLFISK